MQIFITGATGYIGAAVVRTLIVAGHQVTGLARSAEKEDQLRALGATPLRGDLKSPESYREAAAEHDASIHVAFEYSPEMVHADRVAVDTLSAAARQGRTRSLIYTSGVLVLGNTGDTPVDERAPVNPLSLVAWRPEHERIVLDAATDYLATAVIRPGFVYGGVKGLLADWFAGAVREGAATYVGDGTNRMSLVHRDDVAQLYLRVVEEGAAGVFHGVDGGAPRIADLARAASQAAGRGGATRSIPVEQARAAMGPFADALCTDQVITTSRAAEVGWHPAHRPLPEGIDTVWQEWRTAAGQG